MQLRPRTARPTGPALGFSLLSAIACASAPVRSIRTNMNLSDPADEPPIMAKDTAFYESVDQPLYVNGRPWPGDVVQSHAGDCYFLATLSQLAGDHPDVIAQAIRDNGNNTFTIRFYELPRPGAAAAAPSAGGPKIVEIQIDRQLPIDAQGRLVYASKRGRDAALWPSLIEKAFAKWKGGYDAIGAGGNPGQVLFNLTGWRVRYFDLHRRATATEGILPWLQEGDCILATTPPSETRVPGLVPRHVYAVVGSIFQNGERFVVLRNPWGKVAQGSSRSGDGVFLMSAKEFTLAFSGIVVGGPAFTGQLMAP